MIRRIAAVIIGVITGGISLWLVENWLSHLLIDRLDSRFPQDPALVADYVAALPMAAKWMVVLAVLVGGFVASFVALKISKGDAAPARDAGFIMLLLTVVNLFAITHPTWMSISMPLATILGSLIALRFATHQKNVQPESMQ
jgi:Na+-driven multidrug efflux pump